MAQTHGQPLNPPAPTASTAPKNPWARFPLKTWVVPSSLDRWRWPTGTGPAGKPSHYLDQVPETPFGSLRWTRFPIRIYVPLPQTSPSPTAQLSAQAQREQDWHQQISQAIAAWSPYLPLQRVQDPTQADIQILRKHPPLRRGERARNAETRYSITPEPDQGGGTCLRLRQIVWLGDRQSGLQLLGTARHELGHALGIWGHSPLESDALHSFQGATPPGVSPRDVLTLQYIYNQPTRLGCVKDVTEGGLTSLPY